MSKRRKKKEIKTRHQGDKKNAAPSIVPTVASPMVTGLIYANPPSDPDHDLDLLLTEVIQAMRKMKSAETHAFSTSSFNSLADQARAIIAEKRRYMPTEAQSPSNE